MEAAQYVQTWVVAANYLALSKSINVGQTMENNREVSFYMEISEFVDMNQIANILNINDAGFCVKGEVCVSKNKKIKYVSEVSYYGFGIERKANVIGKVETFLSVIKNKKNLLKKIFDEFDFTREILIYTWRDDEEDTNFNLNSEQIKLISELGINISITHYNYN